MKLEHTNRLASLTDEQLAEAIEAIEAIEETLARKAGARATRIEGEAEVVPSLAGAGKAHEGIVKQALGFNPSKSP